MWGNLKKALEAGRFSLPDSDSLQADLVSVGYKFTSEGKLLLESKQDMRKRGVPSPDEADAVALCFSEPEGSAFPRSKNFYKDLKDRYCRFVRLSRKSSSWKSENRRTATRATLRKEDLSLSRHGDFDRHEGRSGER